MTELSVVLLGLGLGLRHATEVDHVVAVTTLIEREAGAWRAARVAALWGLGHTSAFLALGFAVVVLGMHVPSALERAAELLVGCMLLLLGVVHGSRALSASVAQPAPAPATRSMAVGVVHGMAGSAGVALLASTTIDSRPLALTVALFGFGTVLGMIALTVALSWPLRWSLQRSPAWGRGLRLAAAGLSLALGVGLLGDAWTAAS